jgi:AraC-like DNA-binding protein
MTLTDHDISCLEAAKAMIDRDRQVHHSIEEIAHHAGMGRTRLKTCFKAYYGSGLYAYLREQRLQYALHLLQNTLMPVKAVARAAGYKQTSNFSYAFKKRFGMTAIELRVRS